MSDTSVIVIALTMLQQKNHKVSYFFNNDHRADRLKAIISVIYLNSDALLIATREVDHDISSSNTVSMKFIHTMDVLFESSYLMQRKLMQNNGNCS